MSSDDEARRFDNRVRPHEVVMQAPIVPPLERPVDGQNTTEYSERSNHHLQPILPPVTRPLTAQTTTASHYSYDSNDFESDANSDAALSDASPPAQPASYISPAHDLQVTTRYTAQQEVQAPYEEYKLQPQHINEQQDAHFQSAEPTRDDHSAIVDMDEEKNSHNRPTSSLQQTRPRPKSIEDDHDYEGEEEGMGVCGTILYYLCFLIVLLTFPLSGFFCVKVAQEYERAVVFRLGSALQEAKGPGMFLIIPCVEDFVNVDLRTLSIDVPPQEILTKDCVTISVDAVVYYKVVKPQRSVMNVSNCYNSTVLLAHTTLRNVLGTRVLAEILTEREAMAAQMQDLLDVGTKPWGVKVERVEIKDVRLPRQLQRAMAKEAESKREAQAKLIAAEGEKLASRGLTEASNILGGNRVALQIRYLQTLSNIAVNKKSTILFPLPMSSITSKKKR